MMEIIFDIGMYDASDTIYYLEEGYKVIGVEANPDLVQHAKVRLKKYIESDQLYLVNAAIGPRGGTLDLLVSGDDLGSSSIIPERVDKKNIIKAYSVPSVSIEELFRLHGLPLYMKVDIEGADRLCVLGLTRKMRPRYLSFEIGEDVEELVSYAEGIGYTQFKIINQCNFLELANQERFYDRAARRILRIMGFAEPLKIKRAGRFFRVEHSSGPVPWKSNGKWYSNQEIITRWKEARESGNASGWYDIHAT